MSGWHDTADDRFDVPYDCSVELSAMGNQFLTDIFEAYDKVITPQRFRADRQDQDGALSQAELDELFSTSPGNPWLSQGFPDTTITDDFGRVTLQGWLAQWRYVHTIHREANEQHDNFTGSPHDVGLPRIVSFHTHED